MRFDSISPALRDPLVRTLVTLLIIIATLYLAQMIWGLLMQFGDLILVFALAWMISFLLEPIVAALSRIPGVPRTAAVYGVYLAALIALVGGVILLVPALVTQSQMAAARLPDLGERLGAWASGLSDFLVARGVSIGDYSGQLLRPLESLGPWLVANAVTLAAATASVLLQIVLTIVISLYLMLDGERLGRQLLRAVPQRYRDDFTYFTGSVYQAFGGFLRGQIIQSLVYGVGIAALMLVAGLPFVALVSVLAGVSIFIPFLGPFLGTIPPIAIALATDLGSAWLVIALTIALNIVVVNVVAPKVMSQQIGLHPIVVLAAVFLGARLGGAWGALFGVPVAAVIVAMVSFYQLTLGERERRLREVTAAAAPSDTEAAEAVGAVPTAAAQR